MYKILLLSIALLLCSCNHKIPWFVQHKQKHALLPEKSFVVVIPSYNNSDWYRYNLDSVYQQHYKNFSVIYIDDCSTDGTATLVGTYIKKKKYKNIMLIKNTKRVGALANVWHAIRQCNDNTIILTLDGDDWFAHNQVLTYLNVRYQTEDIWLTYGQFQNWPTGNPGWCQQIPARVINTNSFRDYGFWFAQPRSFYAWLAKKINPTDLLAPHTNTFYQVAGDVALMFPMVEMAGRHIRFIDQVLYYHNVKTPLNDFKVHHDEQIAITQALQKRHPYQPLAQDWYDKKLHDKHVRKNTAPHICGQIV